jgi:hypothetical protein
MARYVTIVDGVPRLAVDPGVALYDQSYSVVAPITSGTAITLPASETYTGAELQVFLNGQLLDDTFDFNWVGSPPRTQITMTFDLVIGDVVRFLKKS